MKKLFEGKVLTIPNLLSCLRLALIPAFVWTYLVRQDPEATVLLLLISGLSDVADGFIARPFHMISNLGKVLDPLADAVDLRGVVPVVLEGPLGDDLPPVQVGVHPMDGDAIDLHAVCHSIFHGMRPLEGRQQ